MTTLACRVACHFVFCTTKSLGTFFLPNPFGRISNRSPSIMKGLTSTLTNSYFTMASIVFPILVSCFFAAFIAEGMQTGFRYTPKVINPDLNKFNPVKGAKKIFGIKGLKTFLVDFLEISWNWNSSIAYTCYFFG